jgi:type I restriction enzyme R subunit
MVEYVRQQLRDLMEFVDREQRQIVYTDFVDEMGEIEETEVPIQQTGFSPYQYRKKVEAYIKANENHVAIAKLKRNIPLTETDLNALEDMLFNAEEIESRERFEEVFGKQFSLTRLIREIVGLDRGAAKEAFARYLEQGTFSANQIRFVETIIDYLTQNGVMDPGLLYEPPFQDFHYEGLDGVFAEEEADDIISIVRSFNETVSA